jgi:hypothetical protein
VKTALDFFLHAVEMKLRYGKFVLVFYIVWWPMSSLS